MLSKKKADEIKKRVNKHYWDTPCKILCEVIDELTEKEPEQETEWKVGDWFVSNNFNELVLKVNKVNLNTLVDYTGRQYLKSHCRKVEVIFND